MKYVPLLLLLAALSAPHSYAQQSETNYSFDCTKLSYASQGCQSYNEMIAKGDKDLLSEFSDTGDALICFRPDEDVFFVVSFLEPGDSSYAPSPKYPNVLQVAGFLSYSRFKDGVQEDNELLLGQWQKPRVLKIAPIFSAKDDEQNMHGAVSATEVSYDNKFLNLNNTRTVYTLQIRRSTLRFSETYTFPDVSPGDRSKAPVKSQMRTGSNGYCAEFNSLEAQH